MNRIPQIGSYHNTLFRKLCIYVGCNNIPFCKVSWQYWLTHICYRGTLVLQQKEVYSILMVNGKQLSDTPNTLVLASSDQTSGSNLCLSVLWVG